MFYKQHMTVFKNHFLELFLKIVTGQCLIHPLVLYHLAKEHNMHERVSETYFIYYNWAPI